MVMHHDYKMDSNKTKFKIFLNEKKDYALIYIIIKSQFIIYDKFIEFLKIMQTITYNELQH